MRALALPIGDDCIALTLESVEEVLRTPELHRLPTAPSEVLGLFNLRGQSVPLLDTAAILGLPHRGHAKYAVVIGVEDGRVALSCSGTPATTNLLDRLDDSALVGGIGVYQSDRGIVSLVDPLRALEPLRSEQ